MNVEINVEQKRLLNCLSKQYTFYLICSSFFKVNNLAIVSVSVSFIVIIWWYKKTGSPRSYTGMIE